MVRGTRRRQAGSRRFLHADRPDLHVHPKPCLLRPKSAISSKRCSRHQRLDTTLGVSFTTMPVCRQGHILLHRNIVVDLSYGGTDIGKGDARGSEKDENHE